MREEEWRKIRANFEQLVSELDIDGTGIADYLYAESILTEYDREQIKRRETTLEKNRTFLEILKKKDDDAYRHFRVAVGKYTPWLLKYLQPPAISRQQQAAHSEAVLVLGELSTDELKDWLRPKLEKENLPLPILDTIAEEDIDGQVFENLTEENLKEVFPGLKFGQRKKLFLLKNEAAVKSPAPLLSPQTGLSIPAMQRTEYVRHFGHDVKITEKYHQGKILNKHEARTGSLITPIRQFVPFPDQSHSPKLYELLANKAAMFAAACLNDRQNGTIYFGIGDADCAQYVYGEVVGFPFDRKELEDALSLCIKRRFCGEKEAAAALKCIKPPVFIDVIPADKGRNDALVICEVDVEPQSGIVKGLDFFLNCQPSSSQGNQIMYRFDGSFPVEQNPTQLRDFWEKKPDLEKERKQQEKMKSGCQKSLMQTLRDCLCGGGDKLDGNFYPLLVIPAIDTSHKEFGEAFRFLFDVDWRGIFDFDPESDENGLYLYMVDQEKKVYNVKTTTDFLPAAASLQQTIKSNPEEHFQDMIESPLETWLFCNGYTTANEDGMSVADWKRRRKRGFREAVDFFKRTVPPERAVVIILLTSNDDVLIEASEEILLTFEHQWLAVAESEKIVDAWVDGLLKRDVKIDKQRCLFGFPFVVISRAVQQLQGKQVPCKDVCIVKSSTGVERQLPKDKECELFDLEIISSNQCCIVESMSEEESSKLSKETEEDFYKGNKPSFWNFYFEGHVCRRDKYPALLGYTKDTLKYDAPDKGNVRCVAIYHQPGAGGTTVAMNVLWDLHEEFTCCLAVQITKDTAQQILTLYEFAGSSPDERNPILLLLDNEDDDKIDDLQRSVNDECESRGIQQTVCVFLFCFRRLTLPQDHEVNNILLQQSVSVREKRFFLDKYQELKRKGKGQANLDSLLGLNIMKENFNEEYILRTVSTFVQVFHTVPEKNLLKYIALLNVFDLSFRPIPISCFDPIMQHSHTGRGPWEEKLTPEPLLTFVSTTKLAGRNKCLKVTNKLLCKYILDVTLGNDMSAGALMEEFLHSPVFKRRSEDFAYKELSVIVRDIMKKREWVDEGKRSTFSPFIQMLYDDNDYEQATVCIELVFENSEDPVLAQQLARFHICCKRWDEAEKWAREATTQWPTNSCMWDTHGQVYRYRLMEIQDETEASHDPPSIRTLENAVSCAYEGFRIFRQVQELSKKEKVTPPNAAGYFGQMDVTVLLIKIMKCHPCFQPMDALHAFFCGSRIPAVLESQPLRNYIPWWQSLLQNFDSCIRLVQDMVDLNPSEGYAQSSAKVFLSESNLHRYTTMFSDLFSEDDPMVVDPGPRSPEGRQRLIRKLGGNSLYSVMDLHRQEESKNKVARILQIAVMNLKAQKAKYRRFDLSMALASSLTLNSFFDDPQQAHANFSTLLKWSLELYNLKEDIQYTDLDKFIYLFVFHWPTPQRERLADQCEANVLVNATKFAREAFKEKFESVPNKKNFPLYFLTKKAADRSVISKDQLQVWGSRKGGGPVTVKRMVNCGKAPKLLERFKGILGGNGTDVKVILESTQGHKMEVRIPLLTKQTSQTLRNKEVYFILGFGPGGPIACDVTSQLPQLLQPPQFATGPPLFVRPPRPDQTIVRCDFEIEMIRQKVMKIGHLQQKQSLTQHETLEIQNLPGLLRRLQYLQTLRRNSCLHSMP